MVYVGCEETELLGFQRHAWRPGLKLGVRRLELRNLCDNANDDDSCRVTVSDKDFGVVKSHFVQPVGVYAGTIAVPGRAPLALDGVLGVTEDQDVLW